MRYNAVVHEAAVRQGGALLASASCAVIVVQVSEVQYADVQNSEAWMSSLVVWRVSE